MSSRKRRPSGPTQPGDRAQGSPEAPLLPAVHRGLTASPLARGAHRQLEATSRDHSCGHGGRRYCCCCCWLFEESFDALGRRFAISDRSCISVSGTDEAEEFIGRAGEAKRMVEAARRILPAPWRGD